MTVSDVLVAAPWIIFGVVLAVMCIRLAGARRAAGEQPQRPGHPAAQPAGLDEAGPRLQRRRRRRPGRTAAGPARAEPDSCPDTPEAQCPTTNTNARNR